MRNEAVENFIQYLEARWAGNAVSLESENNSQDFLDLLKDFAIFEERFSRATEAKELIKTLAKECSSRVSIKGNLPYEAFKLLLSLGIFSEDENLLLAKFQVCTEFLSEEEAAAIAIRDLPVDISDRADLRDIFTFTVDGEQTTDFDDALSFEEREHEVILYVHIADVSSYVPKDSILDQVAKQRKKTFYLVDRILPVFPEALSYDLFPLREQKDSLALTTKIIFDKNFQLQSFEIFESVIRVDKNYSYTEFDEFLHKKPNRNLAFLPLMSQLCRSLQKARIDGNGGIDILLPNISAFVQKRQIRLKIYNPQENGAFLVRELMILNNFLYACYAEQEDIVFLYLCQEPPKQEYKLSNRYITKRHEFSQLGGILQRSYFSTKNMGHFALGLEHYTQVTSPIRRYIDIILQRQIRASLRGDSLPYTREELEDEAEYFESGKFLSSQLEAERQKYYLLKYHAKEEQLAEVISGTIIKILSPTECLVELHKTHVTCKVRYENKSLAVYQDVDVKLHSVYPRLGLALGKVV